MCRWVIAHRVDGEIIEREWVGYSISLNVRKNRYIRIFDADGRVLAQFNDVLYWYEVNKDSRAHNRDN